MYMWKGIMNVLVFIQCDFIGIDAIYECLSMEEDERMPAKCEQSTVGQNANLVGQNR